MIFSVDKNLRSCIYGLNSDRTNSIATTSQIVDFDGGDADNVDFTTNIGTFDTSPANGC